MGEEKKTGLPSDVTDFLGMGQERTGGYDTPVRPPAFGETVKFQPSPDDPTAILPAHADLDSFDERTKRERKARAQASVQMLFGTDVSKLDDAGASALYQSVTEGIFGLPDEDGSVAFGKRASKDPRANIEMLRKFVKGDYTLIEDPEYSKWRQMDDEAKFKYALEHETFGNKIKSNLKGERGSSAFEWAARMGTSGAPGFQLPEEERGDILRRANYETLTDEEKAKYRADVVTDYDEKISRRQTLATFLQFAHGLSDRAGYLLAKSFSDGTPDAANIEGLPEDERDRVYAAFSLMRGDQKKGHILGIETDFTDNTRMNRFQLGLYGFQQSVLGLFTDVVDTGTDLTMSIYGKCIKDESERKAFFEGWNANVRAEQAMKQGLPEADSFFGEAFQGVAENFHWLIPYQLGMTRGTKVMKAAFGGAKAAVTRAKLQKVIVEGELMGVKAAAEASRARWLADVEGAVKAGRGARKVGEFTSKIVLDRQLAAVERYTEALRDISKIGKSAVLKEIGKGSAGALQWAEGEAMAFSAFAKEYVENADAAGISREESVTTAAFVGLINAWVEGFYVPGMESTLTPAQLKSMMWTSALQAIRTDGAAGFRKWLANRIPRDMAQIVQVTATEGFVEEPLQQMAVEHGKAFDRLCQELRKDGNATMANEAKALWNSFAKTLPNDYATFIDTAADMFPSSVGFGLTSVATAKGRQHLHNFLTRHANRRAGATATDTMLNLAQRGEDPAKAFDYNAGLVDVIQQAVNVRAAVEKHWQGGEDGGEAENPHRFEEAITAARRAWRDPQTSDAVQEIANAAGVDVKTAEVLAQYLQTEAEATAFSPQARAWTSLNMSLADIDEATIKTVLPGYVEGSFASDPETGIYSGRVRMDDGTEKTIAYRVGDWSEIAGEYVEAQIKDDSNLGKSFDARQEEAGNGTRWADLTPETRRAVAIASTNGLSAGKSGIFELTDAKGEKVRVNADDIILLANGRLADIGYGAAATQGTVRHETFHSLWRFVRGTMADADVQQLAKTLGVDVTKDGWENELDEIMGPQMERYASGHYVSHAVSSRFDKMLDSWAGKIINFFGKFSPSDEVTDPKTGKPYQLKGLYDSILRGELGSGTLGVELRKVPAQPATTTSSAPTSSMPVEVTDADRAEAEAKAQEEAAKEEPPAPAAPASPAPTVTTSAVPVATSENPADASTPNQRYYRVGLPNSNVKLVGRLEVRDVETGIITSTDSGYHDRGNQNRDDKSEESRALVEKIGANPDPLQIGTVQPIASNGIIWMLPNGDVIIGNHRVNGIRLGYAKGTTAELEKFVREDAAKRGIEIGADVKKPLMVFVLERIESPDGKADVHEVVRLANESQNRGFNIREQAGNDAKILQDNNLLPRMAFRADGRIDETKSGDAIGKFRQETGAQGMVAEDGSLTEEGQTRIQNAALAVLLGGEGNNALLNKIMTNAGRLDMQSELRALMKMTPEIMALAESKPAYDLRAPLAEALQLFTEWRDKDETSRVEKGKTRHDWRETAKDGHRVRGLSWEMFMSQGDMFRAPSEEARILGDLFAEAERLRSFDKEDVESAAGKKRVIDLVSDYLTDYIRNARAVNTDTEDMFGGTPASRADVLAAQRATGGENGARFSIDTAHLSETEKKNLHAAQTEAQRILARVGGTEIGHYINAEFRREGRATLIGKRVTSARDLAALAQIYRNPCFETFRYFFTKDGEVVWQTGITARLPGVTNVTVKTPDGGTYGEIERMAAKLKPDGVWLLHNHPSGHVAPSQQDIDATGELREYFDRLGIELGGHVIIDHDTYAELDKWGNYRPRRIDADRLEASYHGDPFTNRLRERGEPFNLGTIAAYAMMLQRDTSQPGKVLTLISLDTKGEFVTSVANIPAESIADSDLYIGSRYMGLDGFFADWRGASGGGHLIVVGDQDVGKYPAAVQRVLRRQIGIGNATDFLFSDDGVEWDSVMHRGGVIPRPSEKNGLIRSRTETSDDGQMRYSIVGEQGAEKFGIGKKTEAEAMEKAGADRRDIWRKTGWWRSKDGKWRFEMPDPKTRSAKEIESAFRLYGESMPLEEIVSAPELFKAYPELALIDVKFDWGSSGALGRYDPQLRRITLWLGDELAKIHKSVTRKRERLELAVRRASDDGELKHYVQNMDALGIKHGTTEAVKAEETALAEELRRDIEAEGVDEFSRAVNLVAGSTGGVFPTLVHEIQHVIQQIEGFAKGGNPETIRRARDNMNRLRRDIFGEMDKAGFNDWILKQDLEALDKRAPSSGDFRYFKQFVKEGNFSETQKAATLLKLQEAEKVMAANREAALEGLTPEEGYTYLAGEVEARNVERRLGRFAKMVPPWMTEDVPADRQIVRYSLAPNPNLREDIAAALRKNAGGDDTTVQMKRHDEIVFSDNLPFFEFLGLPNVKVVTDVVKVRKFNIKHHLTEDQIAELPYRYNAPVAVMKDGTDGYVLLTDLMAKDDHDNDKPVMVYLRRKERPSGEVIFIATAFAKNAEDEAEYYGPLMKSGLLFADENKIAGLALGEETESILRTQASGDHVLTSSDYSWWSTRHSISQNGVSAQGGNDIRYSVSKELTEAMRKREIMQGIPVEGRVQPWPAAFPKVMIQTTLASVKSKWLDLHTRAKAGSEGAALDLVRNILGEEPTAKKKNPKWEKLRTLAAEHPRAIVAYVHAEEATGRNKIPAAYAAMIHMITGLRVADGIVQTVRANHTGANAVERMNRRAAFDGPVRRGAEYILVDDHVTQGGTLNELRKYIQSRGGKIVAISTLTASQFSDTIAISSDAIQALHAKFGNNLDEELKEAGIANGVAELTQSQARELLKLRADTLRDRLAQARLARHNEVDARAVGLALRDGSGVSGATDYLPGLRAYLKPDGTFTETGTRWAKAKQFQRPISRELNSLIDDCLNAGEMSPEETAATLDRLIAAVEATDEIKNSVLPNFRSDSSADDPSVMAVGPDGKKTLTPERDAIHQRIYDLLMGDTITGENNEALETEKDGSAKEEAVIVRANEGRPELPPISPQNPSYETAKEFRIDIIVGPPAAGKSSVFANALSVFYRSRVLDCDAVKKMLPGFNDGNGANYVHAESSMLNKRMIFDIQHRAEGDPRRGENVVLPVLGDDVEGLRKKVAEWHAAGYTVYLHNNRVPILHAFGRAVIRTCATGRWINPIVIKACQDNPTRAYNLAKKDADYYDQFSNDVNFGDSPIWEDGNYLDPAYGNTRKMAVAVRNDGTIQEGYSSNRGGAGGYDPSGVDGLRMGNGNVAQRLDGRLGRNLTPASIGGQQILPGMEDQVLFSTEAPRSALVYPQLRGMSDEELVSAAVAARIALGKSDKVSDRSVKVTTVQKMMRRLHPDWDTTKIGVESMRVMSGAQKLAKRIRDDIGRGVSDSLIIEHLPDTMREQFGREMRQEAREGARLGAFGVRANTALEERQARIVEDAVRVQTGLDSGVIENAYGINLSETIMHLAENPLTEKDAPQGTAGEGEGSTDEEGAASAEESEEAAVEIDAKVKAVVDDIVAASGRQAGSDEQNRQNRKAAAGRDAENEAAMGEGEEGSEGEGDSAGEGFEGDALAEAVKKSALDLENPRHLARFVAELARRQWIQEHHLAKDADVWRDLVAVQFLRKTAQSVYSKLVRDLTYSRSRETAMGRIAKLDNVPTVAGLLSEMEFLGALVNAQRIREKQKSMCEKLDLFLRENFSAQGRFKPDKEEGKRKVSAEAELRARYMRHAMWLTPDAAAEEARQLQETLDALAVDFKDAGRDRDQSREFVETIRKLNVLREFGALRYKPVGEIEAAVQWWQDFARGESDDIVREMSDRDIRTKKAAHLLAVAFADPKRTTIREGGKADALNRFITGHMGFISLLQDCMRHASDADAAAVKDIVDYIAREVQKAGDRSEAEKRRHNDAFHSAVEGIYGKSFNAVMKDMMAPDERFTKYMGVIGGKRVTPTKGRALQLLVSLLQEGRKIEVEDEENPGQTKTVWEGGYHDNIVKHHREGQAAEIMRLLDPADMNMLKWLGQWYENNRSDLSQVCHSLFGIGVYAELPNYFPVKMMLETQGLEKGQGVGWTIFPKALTPRVRNERDFDTSADIFSMWASRMEEAAQWKHHAQLGLEMRGIFGRSELREAVRANHGASVDELMQGFITDILAGHGAYDRSTAGVQYFSDQIRGWTALCALGGNIGVTFKQTTSIPAFGFEIGLVNTAKYMVSAFTPEGMAAMGKIWDSEQRRTRWNLGSSEAVRNALSQQNAGLLKRLLQKSMVTTKLGDVVPALVVGQGIYRDCLDRGMSEEDAMAETWSIIERTQQSGRMENQTSIQRRNKLGRIMFQFLSTQQQYLQYEVRAIREVIARPDSVKRWGSLGRAILLNHFILSSAYYWMGQLYKYALGQEPPEDELKDWIITCLLGPYGSLFVAGFCCKYTLERAIKGYSIRGGSSMLPMESWLKNQVNDGAKLLEAIFDSDGDTWDNILDAAGRWMSDSNSVVRDLRKIYRYRVKDEQQKEH